MMTLLVFYLTGIVALMSLSALYAYFIDKESVEYGDIFNVVILTSWLGVVVAITYHISERIVPFNNWWKKLSKRVVIKRRH